MAVVGSWGSIVFSVSRGQVRTFDGLKWDTSAKYATHDRHLQSGLLEFTGTDPDGVSFTMFFSSYLGVDPSNEIAKLDSATKEGTVARLVIGGKSYGKFVCTKVSKDLERFGHRGGLLAAKASVTLKEYAGR